STLGLNTRSILLYYPPEPSRAKDPLVLALLSLLSVLDRRLYPMATATDRQKTAKENFAAPDSGERKVSLLVVEDDEIFRLRSASTSRARDTTSRQLRMD